MRHQNTPLEKAPPIRKYPKSKVLLFVAGKPYNKETKKVLEKVARDVV